MGEKIMIEFTYKKDNGDISHRKLMVLNEPSDLYFGVDVTNVDKDTTEELNMLMKKQGRELEEFLVEKSLTSKYRSFKKNGVTI